MFTRVLIYYKRKKVRVGKKEENEIQVDSCFNPCGLKASLSLSQSILWIWCEIAGETNMFCES